METYKELIRRWQKIDAYGNSIPDDEICPTQEELETWETNTLMRYLIIATWK